MGTRPRLLSKFLPWVYGLIFIISFISFSYALYLSFALLCVCLASMYMYRGLLSINSKHNPITWQWAILAMLWQLIIISFGIQKDAGGLRLPVSSWHHLFILGLAFGLPIFILTMFCVRGAFKRRILYCYIPILIVSYAIYGAGIAMKINTAFDQSAATIYHPTILSKDDDSWGLKLSSWGKEINPQHIHLPWDMYRSTKIGETVCISLYSGALNIPWYTLQTTNCDSK